MLEHPAGNDTAKESESFIANAIWAEGGPVRDRPCRGRRPWSPGCSRAWRARTRIHVHQGKAHHAFRRGHAGVDTSDLDPMTPRLRVRAETKALRDLSISERDGDVAGTIDIDLVFFLSQVFHCVPSGRLASSSNRARKVCAITSGRPSTTPTRRMAFTLASRASRSKSTHRGGSASSTLRIDHPASVGSPSVLGATGEPAQAVRVRRRAAPKGRRTSCRAR